VRIHADSLQCAPDAATPVALIVNELVSNAFKHAFPNGRAGQIDVSLMRRESGRAILSVTDDGVDAVEGRRGGGLAIVQAFAEQLNGEFEILKGTPKTFVVTFDWPDVTGDH
jgi:two-component sensor histidine kinase